MAATTSKTSTTAKKTTAKTTAKKTTAKKTTAKKTTAKKPALMLLKGEKQQTSGILSSILGDNNLMNNLSGLFPGFNLTRDINEEE